MAVVSNRQLWIAHVGDSRAVLCPSTGNGALLHRELALCTSHASRKRSTMRMSDGSRRSCTPGMSAHVTLTQPRTRLAKASQARAPSAMLCPLCAISARLVNAPRAHAVVALSDDHKPNRNDEHDRIEAGGGAVIWAGTWRVAGVLAVSRAFGDRPLKKCASHPVLGALNLRARLRVLSSL